MQHESLGREAAEQPFDDPVLQVEVHNVFIHGAGIVEHNGANRRFPAPFPGFLVAFPGDTQRVHGFGPGRIGAMPLIERGEPEAVDGFIPVFAGGKGFQRVRVHQLQGAGDGGAEMVFPQSEPFL